MAINIMIISANLQERKKTNYLVYLYGPLSAQAFIWLKINSPHHMGLSIPGLTP
jgi:hypothetical protein